MANMCSIVRELIYNQPDLLYKNTYTLLKFTCCVFSSMKWNGPKKQMNGCGGKVVGRQEKRTKILTKPTTYYLFIYR